MNIIMIMLKMMMIMMMMIIIRVWFKFGNYIEQRASKSSLDVVQIVLHEKDS